MQKRLRKIRMVRFLKPGKATEAQKARKAETDGTLYKFKAVLKSPEGRGPQEKAK